MAQTTAEELVRTVNLGPYPDAAARAIIRNARDLLENQARELREAANEMIGGII